MAWPGRVDAARLVEFLGPDNVLFGSDYPHPEGMAEPLGFVDLMGDAGEEAIRKVMRDNTAGLLKLG